MKATTRFLGLNWNFVLNILLQLIKKFVNL